MKQGDSLAKTGKTWMEQGTTQLRREITRPKLEVTWLKQMFQLRQGITLLEQEVTWLKQNIIG